MKKSLPSRGAWIEIAAAKLAMLVCSVAPLAGSVDRNNLPPEMDRLARLSLPSRGAWIEIWMPPGRSRPGWSLPSRGAWIEMGVTKALAWAAWGRSPRGERG